MPRLQPYRVEGLRAMSATCSGSLTTRSVADVEGVAQGSVEFGLLLLVEPACGA